MGGPARFAAHSRWGSAADLATTASVTPGLDGEGPRPDPGVRKSGAGSVPGNAGSTTAVGLGHEARSLAAVGIRCGSPAEVGSEPARPPSPDLRSGLAGLLGRVGERGANRQPRRPVVEPRHDTGDGREAVPRCCARPSRRARRRIGVLGRLKSASAPRSSTTLARVHHRHAAAPSSATTPMFGDDTSAIPRSFCNRGAGPVLGLYGSRRARLGSGRR